MALKTVTGKVTDPAGVVGTPLPVVSINLSQPASIPGTQEIINSAILPVVAADGTYSVSLQANGDLTPLNTYYTVTESRASGSVYSFTIIVPQTAGPFVITNIMAAPAPVSPLVALANPMTTVNDIIVGGTAGVATRLGVGASGSVLTVDPVSGNLAWDSQSMFFGDGSDGAATLDGTVAAPAWATKSGNTYTMTRDCFCTTLVVTSPGILATANYRVFAKTSITGNGTIDNSGINGSGITGGIPVAAGTVGTGGPGANGTNNGVGNPGSNLNPTLSPLSGASSSGAGGAGGANAGGAAGTTTLGTAFVLRGFPACITGRLLSGSQVSGGAGGGGGGGATAGDTGGGGGSGGQPILLAAPVINITGAINSKGGNGATGALGNGGGGGGGGGGWILAVGRALTSLGTTSVAGGSAGAGLGTGGAGGAGQAGSILQVAL